MTVTERLLHYVSFDTQSDESSETCPSTAKQKLLGEALVEEMRALGIADARIDADGYVYGSPARTCSRAARITTAGSSTSRSRTWRPPCGRSSASCATQQNDPQTGPLEAHSVRKCASVIFA